MCVIGDGIRKTAEITAGASFTHQIMMRKRKEHALITHGIYKHIRHPGYFGWFMWAVGTQVLLCNPFSIMAFTYLSWNFFNDRIPFEEDMLRGLFPGEYDAYARRTPIYIPFIAGAIPVVGRPAGRPQCE